LFTLFLSFFFQSDVVIVDCLLLLEFRRVIFRSPGNPYWLNDPCYAWVLSVDDYCCENEWDEICQLTYNYCDGTWSGPLIKRVDKKELVRITDLLGRPTKESKNKLLFYIYNDGSVERKLIKQ